MVFIVGIMDCLHVTAPAHGSPQGYVRGFPIDAWITPDSYSSLFMVHCNWVLSVFGVIVSLEYSNSMLRFYRDAHHPSTPNQ